MRGRNVKCEHEGFSRATGLYDVPCSVRSVTWSSLTLGRSSLTGLRERPVEEGVNLLPIIRLVVMPEQDGEHGPQRSYIPIDPCQPVIAAIRIAMEEGIDRAYLDRDVDVYEPTEYPALDPYALKYVSLASFSGASLPFLPTGPRQRRNGGFLIRGPCKSNKIFLARCKRTMTYAGEKWTTLSITVPPSVHSCSPKYEDRRR